ncbi:MAG: stage II sporulation protein M, partial [Candidatus Micrarchaeota archaeon]
AELRGIVFLQEQLKTLPAFALTQNKMVLDVLIPPRRALRQPWLIAVASAVFVTGGVALQLLIPSLHASAVIFAMVPAIPLIWTLLMHEERLEENACYRFASPLAGERKFFEYHSRLILVFAWFFFGAIVAYCAWYAVLPAPAVQSVFGDQLNEVKAIEGFAANAANAAGNAANAAANAGASAAGVTGRVFSEGKFLTLLTHNLQVLGLMFLFCLVYGVGSVYLLLWNASIIGVVIGARVKAEGVLGFATGFLGLFPHGIFEVAAYFVASIAGGILSMAVTRFARSKCPRREAPALALDVVILAVVSVALIAIGAAIESSY